MVLLIRRMSMIIVSLQLSRCSSFRSYDPFLIGNKIAENQYDDFDEFLTDVDMVVIMVKHDHIKQNWDKLKGKVILDCFNICPLEDVYHI